jgi:two-component system, chemotaxis family, chemotaxis protein CheY
MRSSGGAGVIDRTGIPVLVVDDYMLTREMVVSILRQIGFLRILVAEDGEQAITQLGNHRFGLVICDWNMPNVTGIEVLKAMRDKDEAYAKTPFLMLTAEGYRENVVAAKEAGVTDYIVKPFTALTLIKKIEELDLAPTK